MNNGGPQTPYLHLAYGSDQGENRNWDILDQKAFDLARNLIANIPAGGDLTGFYPDPTIADGAVQDVNIESVSWGKITGVPASVAGFWQDVGQVVLMPTDLRSVGIGTGQSYYLDGATSLFLTGAGNQLTLETAPAGLLNLKVGSSDATFSFSAIGMSSDTGFSWQRQFASFSHAVQIGADTASLALPGMIQWTGTHFQGRTGSAWVDLDAQPGGTPVWTDNPVRKSITPANTPRYIANVTDLLIGPDTGAQMSFGMSNGQPEINYDGTLAIRSIQGITVFAADTAGHVGFGMVAGTEMVNVNGAITIRGASGTPLDGTLQYTGTTFQGRVAGAWVDIPGAGGSGGGWTDTGTTLVPTKGSTYPIDSGNFVCHGSQIQVTPPSDGSGPTPAISVYSHSASAPGVLAFGRSRPSLGVVQAQDALGVVQFNGIGTGSTYALGASMRAIAAEAFSATAGGTRLTFNTAPLGSQTTVERLGIESMGSVTIPGPSGAVDRAQLVLGSQTAKGRVAQLAGLDWMGFTWNAYFNGSTWVYDDASKPAWLCTLASDAFSLNRAPAGGAFGGDVFKVSGAGRVTIPGSSDTTDRSSIVFGQNTVKGRLLSLPGSDHLGFSANSRSDGASWVADDTSKGQWRCVMDPTTDIFAVYRNPGPGGSSAQMLRIDGAGANANKVTCTLADGSVTAPMLAAGVGVRQFFSGTVTANLNTTTAAVKFATVTGSNLNGRFNIISLFAGLAVGVVAAGQGIAIKVQRNGVDFAQYGGNMGAGAATEFPFPLSLTVYDSSAPAGTVIYDFFMWTSAAGTNIHTPVSTQGSLILITLA